MGSSFEKHFRIAFPDTFPEYLELLDSRVAEFEFPLDASVEKTERGDLKLRVPKVTLMDLYVLPTTRLEIRHSPSAVDIFALDTDIQGSHHIESLELNDRFDLRLHVNLKAKGDIMTAFADFVLDVDVPFPFNVTPKPVLEATGNAAISQVLALLMDTLCNSLVRDHIKWVKAKRTTRPAVAADKQRVAIS